MSVIKEKAGGHRQAKIVVSDRWNRVTKHARLSTLQELIAGNADEAVLGVAILRNIRDAQRDLIHLRYGDRWADEYSRYESQYQKSLESALKRMSLADAV